MRRLLGFVLLASLLAGPAAYAQQERLAVHAQVTPRATLEAVTAATPAVTVEDLARGFLEHVVHCRVRSNDPRGFLLKLSPRIPGVELVELDGRPQAVAVGAEGVELHREWNRGVREVTLRLRVLLDGAAAPGVLAVLPVELAVAAL
jgi:hypothetical protein